MTDRPKIPHDKGDDNSWFNRKRSILNLAESGKRLGIPVKQIPLLRTTDPHGRVNENEKPYR